MSGKKRPKWGKVSGPSKKTLNDVALNFVKYMELAKAARNYLKATNRYKPKIDFMLQVEADFISNSLKEIFKVSDAFIIEAREFIFFDKEKFKDEVKRFSDGAIPEKPLIVTGNMKGELAKITGNKKVFGGFKS